MICNAVSHETQYVEDLNRSKLSSWNHKHPLHAFYGMSISNTLRKSIKISSYCWLSGYPLLAARPLISLEVTEVVNTTDKTWNLLCTVPRLPGDLIHYQVEWLVNDMLVMSESHSHNDTSVMQLESRLGSDYFENITYVDQVIYRWLSVRLWYLNCVSNVVN